MTEWMFDGGSASEALGIAQILGVSLLLLLVLFGPISVLQSRRTRGLRKIGWALLALFLPIVGWLLFRTFEHGPSRYYRGKSRARVCSFCATELIDEARACPYCGRKLPEQ